MRRERPKDNTKLTTPYSYRTAWTITFADFCTLLLTFFVLLVSMSSLDSQTIKKALENFGEKGGLLFFQKLEDISQSPMVVLRKIMKRLEGDQSIELKRIEELQNISEEELSQLIGSGKFMLYKIDDKSKGLTLILNNDIIFERGSTHINPSLFPLLSAIGTFLKQSKYMAFIDGHTDNTPPAAKGIYPSNDDLSFARAKSVLDYLVSREKVPPEKLAIGAYGDRMPLGDNSTPSGRALNRRVEITLKPFRQEERSS
ncbi:MAG: flagellar motor protein MotB [Syntrophobacterales bacterium]|nr:flagellar motor protein MotB [Syntrophobacterales bacterium]